MKATQFIKRTAVAGVTAIAFLAFGTAARAAIIIDFGTGNAGAGESLTLGGQPSGSGLLGNSGLVLGAPLHDRTFATGGIASGTHAAANLPAALSVNTLTDGSSILGGIPAPNRAKRTELLVGTITDFTIVASALTTTNTEFEFLRSILGANPPASGSPYVGASTDVLNASVVPEPGSMFLLGTGLLALAGAARRRMRKSAARV